MKRCECKWVLYEPDEASLVCLNRRMIHTFARVQHISDHAANDVKNEENEENQAPILIHCSAGIGRTGTFIALHCLIEVLEAIKNNTFNNVWGELKGKEVNNDITDIIERFHDFDKPRFSVFGTVRRIKEQRFGMVKTQKQYEFLYAYIENYLKKMD